MHRAARGRLSASYGAPGPTRNDPQHLAGWNAGVAQKQLQQCLLLLARLVLRRLLCVFGLVQEDVKAELALTGQREEVSVFGETREREISEYEETRGAWRPNYAGPRCPDSLVLRLELACKTYFP